MSLNLRGFPDHERLAAIVRLRRFFAETEQYVDFSRKIRAHKNLASALEGIIAIYSRICRVAKNPEISMEYRVYAIGSDGHIVDAMPLICDDDDQAKEKAGELFRNKTIEVWSGERLVTRIDRPLDIS